PESSDITETLLEQQIEQSDLSKAEKDTLRKRLEEVRARRQVVSDALNEDQERIARERLKGEMGEDVNTLEANTRKLREEDEIARRQEGALESQVAEQQELDLNDPYEYEKFQLQKKLDKQREQEAKQAAREAKEAEKLAKEQAEADRKAADE